MQHTDNLFDTAKGRREELQGQRLQFSPDDMFRIVPDTFQAPYPVWTQTTTIRGGLLLCSDLRGQSEGLRRNRIVRRVHFRRAIGLVVRRTICVGTLAWLPYFEMAPVSLRSM